MATAAIPLIELAVSEIPVFLPAILSAVQAVRNLIHKSPGAVKMTPEQAQAAATAALNLAKPQMVTAAATANVGLPGDEQISKYIETVYQIDKALKASPVPQVAQVGTEAGAVIDAVLPLLALVQSAYAQLRAQRQP